MKTQIKISEHQLQQLLMNYLTANGWYVQRMNSGRIKAEGGYMVKLGETGTPDIMAFTNRQPITLGGPDPELKLLFIEVKTPQNPKPTLAQTMKMKELESFGARCIVAHSLEELQELL